jgi:hypothetical protein
MRVPSLHPEASGAGLAHHGDDVRLSVVRGSGHVNAVDRHVCAGPRSCSGSERSTCQFLIGCFARAEASDSSLRGSLPPAMTAATIRFPAGVLGPVPADVRAATDSSSTFVLPHDRHGSSTPGCLRAALTHRRSGRVQETTASALQGPDSMNDRPPTIDRRCTPGCSLCRPDGDPGSLREPAGGFSLVPGCQRRRYSALVESVRTPGTEGAAGRNVGRVRYVSLQ